MPVEIAAARARPTTAAAFDPFIEVHPSMRDDLQAMGLTSPAAFLNLPGEIVSGHPDRHVMRVVLPDGRICFLKKEHRSRWKDRWANWRAGFGWSSKSVREGRLLQQAERFKIGPPWLAFGEDGRERAFLLIGIVPDAIDLRRILHSQPIDRDLPVQLGRFCAELHDAGIDHPDLYAKHFLINPSGAAITLLDWQRSHIGGEVSWARRIQAIAALAATVPFDLYSRWCARFLWAYRRSASVRRHDLPSFTYLAQVIRKRVDSLLKRRGIREQRQSPLASTAQRLVWLDGEAVGAIPEVTNDLRALGLATVLYDQSRSNSELSLACAAGSKAVLRVGSCRSWLRPRWWRAPETRLARLLFHLERYHLPAPKLFAYGHRRVGWRIESFVLCVSPPGDLESLEQALHKAKPFRRDWLLQRFALFLTTLHEAGCEAHDLKVFAVTNDAENPIFIPEPQRLVFRRHLSPRRKKADRRMVIRSMKTYCGTDELVRFAQMLEIKQIQ